MKQILFATTALVALAGVSSAAADVSISGYTRFTYDNGKEEATMDPDYNVWVKADQTSDSGLGYGGAVRLTPGKDGDASSSRHYMYIENELGELKFGQHHGPAYTMSVGSDWRGTISAVGKSYSSNIQGHTTPRIIYQTPNVSGFQLGTSVSQGTDVLGAETQTGLNYSIPFNGSMIKFAHNFSSADATRTSAKEERSETGVQFTHGKFTASFMAFNGEKTGSIIKETPVNYVSIHDVNIPDQTVTASSTASHAVTLPGQTVIVIPIEMSDGSTVYYGTTQEEATGYLTSTETEVTIPGQIIPGYNANVMTRTEATSVDAYEKTEGREVELAYAVADNLTVNLVKFMKDTTDASNSTSSYDRTSIGAKYTIAPGLTASLAHSMIDNAGVDENAMRFRLNFSF